MTIMDMLGQSGVLAMLGVCVVFGFLLMLVIIITIFGKFFAHTADESSISLPAKPAADNAKVVAAITAAVNQYQNRTE